MGGMVVGGVVTPPRPHGAAPGVGLGGARLGGGGGGGECGWGVEEGDRRMGWGVLLGGGHAGMPRVGFPLPRPWVLVLVGYGRWAMGNGQWAAWLAWWWVVL